MRCTQVVGLSDRAQRFINQNVAQHDPKVCQHCNQPLPGEPRGPIMEVYADAKALGMFDDGPDLHEYTLKDGQKVKEIVQAVPWSSGPMIFMCLEDEEGNRIGEWSASEIERG